MGGAYEVVLYFFVGETEFLPYSGRYGFVGNEGERHVDAVKSHPVDLLLPAVPIPIGVCVAIGHYIIIIVVAKRRCDGFWSRRFQ